MKERRAYIVLVAVSLVIGCLSILASLKFVSDSDHKFCQIVNAVNKIPVQKPANPAKDPSREQAWEFHLLYISLGRSLGC